MSETAEALMARARAIAVIIGQEPDFDHLVDVAMSAAASNVFDEVDKVCDSLVPTADDGIAGTFLPAFAMTFLFPLMGERDSWKQLRDRIAANMEVMASRSDLAAILVDGWKRDNAMYLSDAAAPFAN